MSLIICKECGKEISDQAESCPHCGCPVKEHISEPETPKKKGIGGKVVLILLLIVVAAGGFTLINNQRKTDTNNSFNDLYMYMVGCAINSEKTATLIHDVWNNSVFQVENENTDKYTREEDGKGAFYEDFNTALEKLLIEDDDFREEVIAVQKLQDYATTQIQGLSSHPASFDEEYNDFKDAYNIMIKFTNLTFNPNGTLLSYREDFDTLDKELANKLMELSIYIEK